MAPADEAIILAGGRGTRLRPLVSSVPKPLAPVAGRPFLEWLLDRFDGVGIRRCILATGYMADSIERVVGRRWRGMEIAYSVERDPLGTGGGVSQAMQMVSGDSVHVVNGDTYLEYQPIKLERSTCQVGTDIGIALTRVLDASRYGSVLVRDDRVWAFNEKGAHGSGLISAGSYFFRGAVMNDLRVRQGAYSLELDVLLPHAARGNIAAFAETNGFIDIGVPEDYLRAQKLLGSRA